MKRKMYSEEEVVSAVAEALSDTTIELSDPSLAIAGAIVMLKLKRILHKDK